MTNNSPDNNTALAAALLDPVAFAYAIGKKPYPWQCHVMWKLMERGSKVALRAANNSGKTSNVGAPFILWHALAFPGSKCVVTAGAWRQIKEILFPEMRKYARFFPKSEFLETKTTLDNGSIILGQSCADAGLFEGHHNENLLIVADESKSIEHSIFEAITRCVPTRLLLMSSPGMPNGYFYDCFYGDRAKLFTPFQAKVTDCPHITLEELAAVEAEYGKDSSFARSMLWAEFTSDAGKNTIVKIDALERCLQSPPPFRDNGDVRAFCDLAFSVGGDENVLALRKGNRVTIEDTWTGDGNSINTAHRFIKNFQRLKLNAEDIWADNGGAGSPIIDQIASMGWRINRTNNGAASSKPDQFTNRHIQWWFAAARMIEESQIILPTDSLLKSQLVSRCFEPDLKNRVKLQSKSLISDSPDRADAVIGAMQASPFKHAAFYKTKKWFDERRSYAARSTTNNGAGMVGAKFLGKG